MRADGLNQAHATTENVLSSFCKQSYVDKKLFDRHAI